MKKQEQTPGDSPENKSGIGFAALLCIFLIAGLMSVLVIVFIHSNSTDKNLPTNNDNPVVWLVPDTNSLGNSEEDRKIKYGRELIAHTAVYLGPKGKVKQITNGMNCQNCHLNAGTKPFGNNYSGVASTYPKFRERSGTIEDIYKRVNDCMERSLNGTAMDTMSKEIQAIKAYILWLGKDVKKGVKPAGSGIFDLPYLGRAASPEKGETVFEQKCQRCHGENGEGKPNPDSASYQYPPLWGEHSFNIGAGLFRLSRIAGYVKLNMPFEITDDNPLLTDEQAWDVAAFVTSQSRPSRDLSKDWPRITAKPVDHPFGPYADTFSEEQHKFGPFAPVATFKKKEEERKKSN